jgi:hypothetical protein
VSDPNGPSRLQVLAAIQSIPVPLPVELDAILRRLWAPPNAMILVAAAEELGREMQFDWSEEPNMFPEQWGQTLRQAALYETGGDPNSPDFALALPGAAAAVALWLRAPSSTFFMPATSEEPPAPEGRLDPNAYDVPRFDANSTAYLIYHATCSEHQLAGDYAAWHLARADERARPRAFELGMNLLPAPPDPKDPASRRGWRNYSAPSRAAAAMLLALAARSPQEKEQARSRLASRLEGGPLGAPADFYEIGSYKCALLGLGESRFRGEVAALLHSGAFPLRRAMTALSAAGDRAGLDWLLWDLRAPAEEIAGLYIGTRLGEVFSVLVPELPAVDEAAGEDLRDWQVRILQDYYRIHRENIRFARGE